MAIKHLRLSEHSAYETYDTNADLYGLLYRFHLNAFQLAYYCFIFYFYYRWGGTKSLGTEATSGLLYKPQMIYEDDCGAIGGMKIGRGNRSTLRKPAPAPLCPPQNPT
jgi:hypothetical protein